MNAEVKKALISGMVTLTIAALLGASLAFAIVAGIAWIVGVIFGAAINYGIIAIVIGLIYALYAIAQCVLLAVVARS